MTNASGTYVRIIIGAIVGGLISWLVYRLQNKTYLCNAYFVAIRNDR